MLGEEIEDLKRELPWYVQQDENGELPIPKPGKELGDYSKEEKEIEEYLEQRKKKSGKY